VKNRRDRLIAVLVIMPSVILLGIFVYWFIGRTFYISMTDWGKEAPLAVNPVIHFVGLQNYKELFTGILNGRFRQDLVNTFFFTVLFVSGSLGLGLLLAILLDREPRGEGFFRTLFLFPMSLSFIVTGTIWRWLLAPRGGINVLPKLFGLPPLGFEWTSSRTQIFSFNWQDLPRVTALVVAAVLAYLTWRAVRRGRPRRAIIAGLCAAGLVAWYVWGSQLVPPALPYPEIHGFNLAIVGIIIAAIWQFSGYTMALYLAGLRGIPTEVREAARIDGCNELQLYRRVALPMLKPITLSAVIILGHISLKTFDLVFAMTGPDHASTDMPSVLMFVKTFRGNQFAEGAGIAVVLFILVAMVVIPYLAWSLRERSSL